MKKIKKCIIALLLMLFCLSPILPGCDITIFSSSVLKSPIITLNEEGHCLTWNSVPMAEGYDIYSNSKCVASIVDSGTNIVYDLTPVVIKTGTYELYVVATTTSLYKSNSDSSNVVTYSYVKNEIVVPETPAEDIDTEQKIQMTLNGSVLTYLNLDNETDADYTLYLYSNSSGIKSFRLTTNTINLTTGSYMTKDEIYAIRMGYSIDGVSKIASDIIYYNPDDSGTYTDEIYLFDGYINDYYIESLTELRNIMYYSFIYRMTSFNIKISSTFKSFIETTFEGSSMLEMMNNAVAYAFCSELDNDNDGEYETQGGGFFETMSFQANNTYGFVAQLSNSNEYSIKVSYMGATECDTSINPSTTYDQSPSDGYYDICGYQMLEEKYGVTYDKFVSDNQFLYTNVTTTEELYWAVENKVTPVFANKTSRAYIVYNKAKEVLRKIISDQMTNYEKALAIFDWIAINTEYDYTTYSVANGYTSKVNNPMNLPCYYLEGVFITGYSVCDGFSKAYSLMCNMLGIDCIRVMGEAKTGSSSGGHAWNKVLMDIDPTDEISAKYYLADITWTEILSEDEELSHSYFGVSDDDVKETHFAYAGRQDKFAKYEANSNSRYYINTTFNHNDKKQDLVISNGTELSDMFDYMIVNNREAMEVVFDYDYMLSEFEKTYGEGVYKTSSAKTENDDTYYSESSEFAGKIKTYYDYANDTMTYYSYAWANVWHTTFYTNTQTQTNYKLISNFQSVMKASKFAEQFLFLTNDNYEIVYNDNGDKGLLYILTQNLLIDDMTEKNEVEHLLSKLDTDIIAGKFRLYIDAEILSGVSGSTMLAKINNLFNSYISELTNINIELKFVESTNTPSTNSGLYYLVSTVK